MPTGVDRRPRLADAIIESIAIDILRGDARPGSLLPPEPQLSERYGVSRTVVREAIKRLQSLGLIDVRHGIGTIVLDSTSWDDFDPDMIRIRTNAGFIGDLADDLFAIRRVIEVQVVADAATNRTQDQLRELEAIVDQMRTPGIDHVVYTDLDIDFHNVLLEAAGNALLVKMMQPVNQIRRIGSLITSAELDYVIPGSIRGHERILQAIAAMDAADARQQMATHLDEFARDLIRGIESTGAYRR
ncbi:MAG TPA: FadR/GntR family transcriptional regulator [Thermomicrobiales bacterium]|nr:FadR/GntR family transcriptional regulator [Thermomicrobiales bacterium]